MKMICDWCGREYNGRDRGRMHHFCSRECVAAFTSKTKNPERYTTLRDYTKMCAHKTLEHREKIRNGILGRGACHGYSKIFGRSAHRVVAEQMLGRALRPEEVVHHRDGNRYNNAPENLQVFENTGAHTRFHNEYRWFLRQLEKEDA